MIACSLNGFSIHGKEAYRAPRVEEDASSNLARRSDFYSVVAQVVEQLIRNQQASGSSPLVGFVKI